jgi:hypothetical protein
MMHGREKSALDAVATRPLRLWIGPALASPDLVLDAQPPTQPHSSVVVDQHGDSEDRHKRNRARY